MLEIEKMRIFKNKGWSIDADEGLIYNSYKKVSSTTDKSGYIRCVTNYGGKTISVYGHRLLWFFSHGDLVKEIDHIDGNKKNNKLVNLRSVSRQQNQYNKNCKGVYFIKSLGKFQVRLGHNGKRLHFGYYEDFDKAHQAYLDVKKLYFNLGYKYQIS